MRPRKPTSIDGFIPRQSRPDLSRQFDADEIHKRPLEKAPELPEPGVDDSRNDLTASLESIDRQEPPELQTQAPKKRRFRLWPRRRRSKDTRDKKHATPRKKLIKRIILVLLALLIVVGGYFGVRMLLSANKLLHGNFLSLVQPGKPLATDSQGRTNILIFGTSQDDKAHQNAIGGGGLWLTDSIMLVSMNQKNHTVKTVSIPRDLWVNMPGACAIGYQGKINAVYECGGNLIDSDGSAQKSDGYAEKDKQGAHALENTIKEVTGITPQYYVHVNYTVLKQAVNAVGGVDVHIEGDGADGIYDTNFDWDCPKGPYTCKNVYYPHDGTYHLNGKQALFLARARADAGKYSYKSFGLARGDFDRQMNQQKILTALRQKAMSAGTLANPIKMTKLMDAFGDNITTDIEAGHYKTLIEFSKKMPEKNGMTSVSLVKEGESVVENKSINGQSAVVATSGVLNYDSIIQYLAKKFSTNPAIAEDAKIAIYNASDTPGAAGSLGDQLTRDGLTVVRTDNAANADAGGNHYTIYDLTKGKKPGTVSYLKSQLHAVVSESALPSDIPPAAAEIVIVVGSDTTSAAPSN